MCQPAATPPKPAVFNIGSIPVRLPMAGLFTGSRRARLWELPEAFHCPVVGVCLSTKALRRLILKVAREQGPAAEYDEHSLAVNACRERGPLSELMHRELDARHDLAIRQCRPLDTPDDLLAAWQAAVGRGDIAGCFWALLTHPKATPSLRERAYRDVHMLQHQAGASIRVDLQAFDALGRENAVLLREMGKIQRRMSDFVQEKTARISSLEAELAQSEQDVVRLRARLEDAEAKNLQLSRAADLLQQNVALQAAVERLVRKLQSQSQELSALRAVPGRPPASPAIDDESAPASGQPGVVRKEVGSLCLEHKTVFVVGGRLGSFNEYRSTIEQSGARFLFHDGGLEHGMQTLESGLRAADYVICQTGCISHASYWKVKDFCKRTGKRCLYVESPGKGALQQTIEQLSASA